jgi:hypothetical protein
MSGPVLALVFSSLSGCGSESQPAGEPVEPVARPLVVTERARTTSHSCEGEREAPAAREVRFARDVEPILMSGCSGEFCHGLAMTSPSRAYAFLVNQPSFECDDERPLVTPGDPDHSYVVDKVLGRNLCAGHPMPRGFENRLSHQEVRTLTDWICEGAPND